MGEAHARRAPDELRGDRAETDHRDERPGPVRGAHERSFHWGRPQQQARGVDRQVEQLEIRARAPQRRGVVGQQALHHPAAAHLGHDPQPASPESTDCGGGAEPDLDIPGIVARRHHDGRSPGDPGVAQDRLVGGVALEHGHAQRFAGQRIGRVDIQSDGHHRTAGASQRLGDLAAGLAEPADDDVVTSALGQGDAHVAPQIGQEDLRAPEQGQDRQGELGDLHLGRERPAGLTAHAAKEHQSDGPDRALGECTDHSDRAMRRWRLAIEHKAPRPDEHGQGGQGHDDPPVTDTEHVGWR